MKTSILPNSVVYVKYLSKTKYDSYMFAVMDYDKDNKTIVKMLKPFNNNQYIYLKEKVLKKMKINQPELEDYLTSEDNMVLKLYFNEYKKAGEVVEYVDYVSHKKGKTYLIKLKEALRKSREEFLNSLADNNNRNYESESD